MALRISLCLFLFLALFAPVKPALAGSSPVIVELFTSQGCSSCPPAEEIMSGWGMKAFKTRQIIPLAFHVDYWDSLGWKDPFSSSQATARQEKYASFFKNRSLYTPQMVVAGRTDFVGSDGSRANREASRYSQTVSLLQIGIRPSWQNHALRLSVRIKADGKNPSSKAVYQVRAAIFENGLVTRVLRGENAGRTLTNDFVVRAFAEAGVFDTGASEEFSKTLDLAWDPEWKKQNSGLVIFVQNQETFETGPAECVFPVSSPE